MKILKSIGIDWKDRILIASLYLNQRALIRTKQGDSNESALGRGVRQGCPLSPTLFNIYSEAMIKEALEGKGRGVIIGGRNIKAIRFADDKAIVSNSSRDLQIMINRINKIGKKYGMKFNIKKTKTMKVARKAGKLDIMIEGKKLEQIKQYKYLGSIIEEEGRCNKEIRARIGMGKNVFNKKKTTFCSKMDIGLRKRLVKCYVWITMLHGAETWTLRKKDIEMLERFEIWIWRRMEKNKMDR